ncbi:sodium:proton antiporter [Sanguibacter hominis ATCC BAA-789]|uniref:Sodium:proton antiporter n=1 Tax=Sanguibacter hominis ATCC BAA-789 TaxID=1312740 RepID=A0A9X5IRC2_9MICO|nr:DUF6328 family protein [Sanguibacter hominis]NKX92583.1 sodium:proton antiporter [Sanguibacter hominis ATCC BAA-789]
MSVERAPDDATDGRDETAAERADRNWGELLQELRILQTGVQILTGFLLVLPFQGRFGDLDAYQRGLYLVLVMLGIAAMGLLMTPVSVHRAVFQRRVKPSLVAMGDRLARVSLAAVALLMGGATSLAFDVVLGRLAGAVVGVVVVVALALSWRVVTRRVERG